MKLSTKTQLAVREAELIMLGKAYKLLAVAFAKAAPDDVDAGIVASMQSLVADMTDLAKKFPQGITPDHPLAMFARRMQILTREAREDVAKARNPH